MFFEILIAITLGVASGIFTGLIPGIHINLVAAILVALSTTLLNLVEPFPIVIFIMIMSVTHTFIDSIPSIYLGAPDSDMILAALPAHQLLLRGEGHIALILTLVGSLGGLVLSILLFPLIIFILPFVAETLTPITVFLLIALLFYLLLKEKKRFLSFLIFIASGILGFLVFNLPLKQPLFSLLSGLFGISLLIVSFFEKSAFPKQKKVASFLLEKSKLLASLIVSTIVGFVAAFLPGFGASQAAIYASGMIGEKKPEYFLILSGAINTIAMILSLATFTVLQKARNGSVVGMSHFVTIVTQNHLAILLLSMLLTGFVATICGIRISLLFESVLAKLSYQKIILCVVGFLIILTVFFDSLLGLLVLFCATFLGMLVQKLGVSKHYLLGCLLLPTIFYLL